MVVTDFELKMENKSYRDVLVCVGFVDVRGRERWEAVNLCGGGWWGIECSVKWQK